MRRSEIAEQDRFMLLRQREFRIAADVVADAWMSFPSVRAVAVIGSVAKALWKEVPRFSEFRRKGIEVWHECRDLDLALWIDSQEQLSALRRAPRPGRYERPTSKELVPASSASSSIYS
ncbi:hypothetical protein ABIB73_000776 [Bradyrhizobium sp. F1.4.3]|uniref:hypothetical protein n=1 Tax=Bradyrhizobium sp. F1.4.3 TaxID=3156356 RepID=UPI00339A712D